MGLSGGTPSGGGGALGGGTGWGRSRTVGIILDPFLRMKCGAHLRGTWFSGAYCAGTKGVAAALHLGVPPVLDLVPDGHEAIRIRPPLRHDAFKVQPLHDSRGRRHQAVRARFLRVSGNPRQSASNAAQWRFPRPVSRPRKLCRLSLSSATTSLSRIASLTGSSSRTQ